MASRLGVASGTALCFVLALTAIPAAARAHVAAAVEASALASDTGPAAIATPRAKPPAPEPAYADRADIARLDVIRKDLEARNFSRARAAIDQISGATARSLGLWYYFYAEDPAVSIADAGAFLDAHADWPAHARIRTHIEKRMTNATAPETVLSFFNKRDPLTSAGKLHLARALYARGDREAAEIHIRDAFVNFASTAEEERTLIAAYGSVLTPDAYVEKVDRLLWAREPASAQRHFLRLPIDERRRAEVRAALLLGDANGRILFDRLNAADRADPGVLHAAIRHYRRAGDEVRAIALARSAPTDPAAMRNPSRLFEETNLLMRWAIKNRQYEDAYAMAAGHGLQASSPDFAEAEFNAGWIALRFLDDPRHAEVHFAALASSVTAPISAARGWYWLGRASEALKDERAAAARYERAAAYVFTYYGQLAAERLGATHISPVFNAGAAPSAEDQARFDARPVAQAFNILADLRDARAFLIFGYHLDDFLDTPGEYLAFANVAARIGATHVTVRAGKAGVRRGVFAPEVAYPIIPIPEKAAGFAPPEVILGLSRQESEFNPRAYSTAGARGVMQLIPSTAEITAKKERMTYNRAALLDDPTYNITIGAAHLSHLLKDYNGSLIMTFAAYNAGKSRVTQWMADYGDPRSGSIDPVDWVEMIPFSETRNYVQRVLENTQVYRSRLQALPIAGRLSADLERGGPANRAGRLAAAGSDSRPRALQPRIIAAADPILNPPQPPPVEETAALEPSSTPASRPRGGRAEPPTRQTRGRKSGPNVVTPAIAAPPSVAGRPVFPPVPRSEDPRVERETLFGREGDDLDLEGAFESREQPEEH